MNYIEKIIVHPADSNNYSEVEVIPKKSRKSTLKRIGAVHIKIDTNALKGITFELCDEDKIKLQSGHSKKIKLDGNFATYI